jgi:hypothetical protein
MGERIPRVSTEIPQNFNAVRCASGNADILACEIPEPFHRRTRRQQRVFATKEHIDHKKVLYEFLACRP